MRRPRLAFATLAALLASLAFAKDLAWRAFDVKARLDASGALHVVETQTIVFDGDWNGGERTFRVFPGQSVDLVAVTRIGRDGIRIPLVPGDLDEVDHFSWTGGRTLRWRSRLPTDPPFSHTEKVYEIAYRTSGILVKELGNGYLLDHGFAFPDREWPIAAGALAAGVAAPSSSGGGGGGGGGGSSGGGGGGGW